jgi:hypothetical protein
MIFLFALACCFKSLSGIPVKSFQKLIHPVFELIQPLACLYVIVSQTQGHENKQFFVTHPGTIGIKPLEPVLNQLLCLSNPVLFGIGFERNLLPKKAYIIARHQVSYIHLLDFFQEVIQPSQDIILYLPFRVQRSSQSGIFFFQLANPL